MLSLMFKYDPDLEKERHMQQHISELTTITFLSDYPERLKKKKKKRRFRNGFLLP